jgi:hypothetical protein
MRGTQAKQRRPPGPGQVLAGFATSRWFDDTGDEGGGFYAADAAADGAAAEEEKEEDICKLPLVVLVVLVVLDSIEAM